MRRIPAMKIKESLKRLALGLALTSPIAMAMGVWGVVEVSMHLLFGFLILASLAIGLFMVFMLGDWVWSKVTGTKMISWID